MNAPDPLTIATAIDFRREREAKEASGWAALPATLRPPAKLETASGEFVPAYSKGLKTLDGGQLLTANFPLRSQMLAPWLPDKGLAMIFAPRGIGKTWIALSIAQAVAGGGEFLRWRATRHVGFSTSTGKCRR